VLTRVGSIPRIWVLTRVGSFPRIWVLTRVGSFPRIWVLTRVGSFPRIWVLTRYVDGFPRTFLYASCAATCTRRHFTVEVLCG
jgi:hypothetical protein